MIASAALVRWPALSRLCEHESAIRNSKRQLARVRFHSWPLKVCLLPMSCFEWPQSCFSQTEFCEGPNAEAQVSRRHGRRKPKGCEGQMPGTCQENRGLVSKLQHVASGSLGRFLFFLWRQLPWVRLRGTVAPMGGPDKFLQKTYGDKAHLSFWQVSFELINLG